MIYSETKGVNEADSDLPLVSVITPNFNGERFIPRLLESVRRQDLVLEHIIVDDRSTDGSWELLKALKSDYPWLRIHRLAQNSGPIIARNQAISMARGRYLAFLDIDDLWLPHKLTTQINFMRSEKCPWSFSDYRFMSEDGRWIGRCLKGPKSVGWKTHHSTRYLGCLTIILDRVYMPDFRVPDIAPGVRAEDFLAWSQCIRKAGPAARCPHDLARYSVVTNSRSSKKFKAIKSVWSVYREIEKIPFITALIYFSIYAVGGVWKQFWYQPRMLREKVDRGFAWSIIARRPSD